MRVDPDAVYLELSVGATVYSPVTNKLRAADAAVLHWKDGRRWHRRSLIADQGETLADVLRNFAGYVDEHGLETLLEKASPS